MSYRGQKSFYYPINPDKYRGNPNNIICRSSWERKLARWCDTNPNVEWWQSEEKALWYKWRDGSAHRYYPDFSMCIQGQIWLVEVKPFSKTQKPKDISPKSKSKKKLQNYMENVIEYQKNQAKWKAATEYCERNGWKFKILTERELNIVY